LTSEKANVFSTSSVLDLRILEVQASIWNVLSFVACIPDVEITLRATCQYVWLGGHSPRPGSSSFSTTFVRLVLIMILKNSKGKSIS
jgi:hypothetical protein